MRRAGFAGLCVFVMVSVACGGAVNETASTNQEPTPVVVRPVHLAPVEEQVAVVGTIRAVNEVVVAARLLGYVQTIAVREGDTVRTGQPLVTLDDRELQAAVAAARAAQREAESAILSAAQGVAATQSQLHLAELTHQRYSDLLADASVSQQEFDVVEARFIAAKSELAAAEAGRAQAEARHAQADAALVSAEVALGYAEITAPISGVVTERMVDPGALAAPGAPLLRIEDAGGYRLEIAAPESRRRSLSVGQVVPVEIDSLLIRRSSGVIAEIVPAIDPRSRTFTVKVELSDAPDVRSGQYGRAFLPGETRETLLIPESAVVARGQLRFVTVVQDGYARRRVVTLGARRGSDYEVLSGLVPGDRVIIDPADMRDGAPVSPRESMP